MRAGRRGACGQLVNQGLTTWPLRARWWARLCAGRAVMQHRRRVLRATGIDQVFRGSAQRCRTERALRFKRNCYSRHAITHLRVDYRFSSQAG
jgi:hypothetical protein